MAHILLADDDPNILLLVKTMLKSDGHTVVTAMDGREALRVGEGQHFDLYILDVMMPAVDGYSLARAFTTRFPGRKVIILSQRPYAGDRILSDASGASYHIQKPFDRNDLLAKVHEALRGGATRNIS